MGAGIGYALTQPAAEAMLVFLSLGLGMATPWLLLCLFPAWAKKLPKPGPWMNTFKKVMAVPMLLALLWLAWVLTKQVDYRGLLIVLLGLAALAAFCWLLVRGVQKPYRVLPQQAVLFSSTLLLPGALLVKPTSLLCSTVRKSFHE